MESGNSQFAIYIKPYIYLFIPVVVYRIVIVCSNTADLVEKLKQTAVELDPAVQRIVHALTRLRTDLQAMRRGPHLSDQLKHLQVCLMLRPRIENRP